ncbi:Porin-like protein NicP precursor [compost metagenome]
MSDNPGKPYAKRAADDYSKLGLTAKARLLDSNELFVGSLQPAGIAVIQPNISRLFPQTFEGQQLTSKAIDNLTLNLGHISHVKQRDSTDFEKMGITSQSGQYASAARSDDFKFVAADYQITQDVLASLHFGRLQDIYQQGFVGLKYNTPLGPGRLLGELRYFDGSDAGAALGGHVNNQTLSTNIGYSIDGHTISGGYQKLWGDTAYPLIDGTVSYLFTELQVSNFSRARERSWRARYDYNFAASGLPGLTFTTVYVQGDQARVVNMNQEGQEWERDTYITYVVQDGPLKNVGVQWLNATQRSNYTRNTDENRLIFSYSLALK